MRRLWLAAVAALACVSAGSAQEGAAPRPPEPIVATPIVPPAPSTTLAAGTEIELSLNEELSSLRHRVGQTFELSVAANVLLGNYVVIPAGTRAVGEIIWMTGRGMFGKSGKMHIAIRYIDLSGRQIPVEGMFRQEGEGNTVATLASVAVAPVVGLFITGHSAVIPAGRRLVVRLRDDIPVILPQRPQAPPSPPAPAAQTPAAATQPPNQ
jgi:hypothetical protein